MPPRLSEAPRDQTESAFTAMLRHAWLSVPWIIALVFVDNEGECIDYVSSIDPYEAKVTGAHLHVLMRALRDQPHAFGGEAVLLRVECARRELWGRRITDEHMLAALVHPGADTLQLASILARCAREFRSEVGVRAPSWEPDKTLLEVVVRRAIGWGYAPKAYSQDGIHVAITDVLGRWVEPLENRDEELVCFRVRTEEGIELTLMHDPDADGWQMRP
jgi:hypothetical protein